MVEDMNSLDDKLFNSAFKRNPSIKDNKKKITLADYNDDDPLAALLYNKEDVLSDRKNQMTVKGTDIDDLYDIKDSNEFLSNSKPNEKENSLFFALNTIDARKSKSDDYFDVKNMPSDTLPIEDNSQDNLQKGKSVINIHKDIIEVDKPKALDEKSKKLSLMHDLFGSALHMSSSKESSINKKPVQSEREASIASYETNVKTQSQHSAYAPTTFGTREPRRSKRGSEIINDPLGLLSLNSTSNQAQQSTMKRYATLADSNKQKSDTKEYLPEWLETKTELEDKNIDYNKTITFTEEKDTLKITESLPQENEKLMKSLDKQKIEINEYDNQKNLVEQDYSNSNITTVPMNSGVHRNSKNVHSNIIRKDIDHENVINKLELEKSHLTVTIHSLNEKYENEIMILDESYKRQIAFLQERTDVLEKKTKQELECLETDYEAKIEKLKTEKMQIETFYKNEIENLKKEHKQFVEEIYEHHSQNIRLLQKEHFNTIESILKMREVENLAVTTIATHKTDVQNLLQKADFIIENIKNVQEKTNKRDDQSMNLRDYYLKNQEEDVQIRTTEMKKQQELLERERDKITKVADKLDTHVTQLVCELEKKSAILNEALETLKKKENFLSHEREIFEEKAQWERNHLQTLKESWFNEQKKQLIALTKEQEVIAAKKKQYEVLKTIKTNSDDLTKIELVAAIKTAQDTTTLANQERLKWQEKIRNLEIQQQNLQEKEHKLLVHAQDLENFTQAAFAKNDEAIKTLKEARLIENEHKVKFDTQFGMLAHRQSTTAEKLNLASERLALRTAQIEKLRNSASTNIPHSYANKHTLSDEQHVQVTTHFTEVVDPQLVMLKLNLDDQLDNMQYMTAMKFL